jgi:hypothetical protein
VPEIITVSLEYEANGETVSDTMVRKVAHSESVARQLQKALNDIVRSEQNRANRRGESAATVATKATQEHEEEGPKHSFRDLFQSLNPRVRAALVEMAEKPGGYPVSQLTTALGLTNAEALGGLLGHVTKAMPKFPGVAMPFHRDDKVPGRPYVMSDEAVSAIKELA